MIGVVGHDEKKIFFLLMAKRYEGKTQTEKKRKNEKGVKEFTKEFK